MSGNNVNEGLGAATTIYYIVLKKPHDSTVWETTVDIAGGSLK